GTVSLVFEGLSTDVNTLADAGLSLLQNRPNPFRDETLIGFVLPADCEAQLRIFDASGRLVAEQKGYFTRGYNQLRFDLGGVAEQGLLYYELVTPFGSRSKKMVLSKE
ncbi:MAG TPA: T9SS type A sorting domain-containing protein, partial [Saprospiraceae bacterium]|nr:T9SS type A sorting domain-containing protein [Saprospiraceae bacterium]